MVLAGRTTSLLYVSRFVLVFDSFRFVSNSAGFLSASQASFAYVFVCALALYRSWMWANGAMISSMVCPTQCLALSCVCTCSRPYTLHPHPQPFLDQRSDHTRTTVVLVHPTATSREVCVAATLGSLHNLHATNSTGDLCWIVVVCTKRVMPKNMTTKIKIKLLYVFNMVRIIEVLAILLLPI